MVLCLMACSMVSHGQELELDLQHVPVQAQETKRALASRGGDLLFPVGLPFVDDFAWPSLYDEEGPVNVKRWESSPVRRTTTLAYRPPTVGCATLDGMDASGNPYALNPTNPVGYADTLTSRRLLLGQGGYAAADSVALSFWYQSGGRANGADAGEDSLVVEFRTSVVDGDPWRWVWSTEGIDEDSVFHPVVLHIDAPEYFHDDFQFRFRNYGSLEGNVDTWHIDYVRVDEDAMVPAPDFEEVAFVSPPSSFLKEPWTAMPWPHFQFSPGLYVANSVPTLHRSFGANANSQENVGLKVQRVDIEGGNVNNYAPAAGSIVNTSVQGLFETDYVEDLQIFTYLFNPAVSDTFAVFHVSLWEDEVGAANGTNQTGIPDNDSLVHVQTFRDYYAYDDGTSEKAYALEGQGGEVVVRHDIQQPDTLEGLWVHFTPFFDDASGETFTLKIRAEDEANPGQPGETIADQFAIYEPDYSLGTYDGFAYFPLNVPVAVEGTIFVGFVQQGEERIHVGLDKNTNTNEDFVWYTFPTTPWQPSGIEGSLMIRPVLRAGKDPVTQVGDWASVREAPLLHPNPGAGLCQWTLEVPTDIQVFDMSGREVAFWPQLAPGLHAWETDQTGMFLLVGTEPSGQRWTQRWVSQ